MVVEHSFAFVARMTVPCHIALGGAQNRIRFGGAIVAALYLEEFVGKKASKGNANGRGTVAEPDDGGSVRAGRNGVKLPWIHIDVMAFNQGSRPGKPEGGEAQGMRALFALLEDMFGAKKA